jgi:prepilin-type N-terminal cleavage/methylation domain-containing protein
MLQERGYTLIEVLVVVGLIGIVSAISVPVFLESNARSSIWTGSERVGAIIRQTRLKAISQNATYRVVFNCPAANQLRGLVMTGDADVDDSPSRCSETQIGDTGVIELPTSVTYDSNDADYLQVTGRGVFSASGAAIPLTIDVNYGASTRTLTVSKTGQISFSEVH